MLLPQEFRILDANVRNSRP